VLEIEFNTGIGFNSFVFAKSALHRAASILHSFIHPSEVITSMPITILERDEAGHVRKTYLKGSTNRVRPELLKIDSCYCANAIYNVYWHRRLFWDRGQQSQEIFIF